MLHLLLLHLTTEYKLRASSFELRKESFLNEHKSSTWKVSSLSYLLLKMASFEAVFLCVTIEYLLDLRIGMEKSLSNLSGHISRVLRKVAIS